MTQARAHRARADVVCAVDVVCFAVVDARLCVLLERASGTFRLPGQIWTPGTSLEGAADVVFRTSTGCRPEWCEQVGASADGEHPDGAQLSVTFVAGIPERGPARTGSVWTPAARTRTGLPSRHRACIASALRHLRARANYAPAALSLLPTQFTLSELQATYELVLGAPVYTASFRRWLNASALIVPSGALRAEQRGRPARLYRRARSPRSAAEAAALQQIRPV